MILYISIMSGIVAAAILFKPFFNDKAELLRCVKFWFTPDLISLFRGKYGEDWYSSMKLGIWIGLSVLAGWGVYYGLMKLFG